MKMHARSHSSFPATRRASSTRRSGEHTAVDTPARAATCSNRAKAGAVLGGATGTAIIPANRQPKKAGRKSSWFGKISRTGCLAGSRRARSGTDESGPPMQFAIGQRIGRLLTLIEIGVENFIVLFASPSLDQLDERPRHVHSADGLQLHLTKMFGDRLYVGIFEEQIGRPDSGRSISTDRSSSTTIAAESRPKLSKDIVWLTSSAGMSSRSARYATIHDSMLLLKIVTSHPPRSLRCRSAGTNR